jgi:hypothetical protein
MKRRTSPSPTVSLPVVKPKALKTFIVSAMVRGLPMPHMPHNNDTRKTVIIRAATLKRVAEILDSTPARLRLFGCTRDDSRAHMAPKPETVYYEPGHTREGYIEGYVELAPPGNQARRPLSK